METRVNKYVIFDRDGTLIELIPYLKDDKLVRLMPGVSVGLKLLKINGFRFGIITNQSAINRKIATEREVISVNNKLREICMNFGVDFDFIFFCPHRPEENCTCRKPNAKLGFRAIVEFGINVSESFYLGDQDTDVEFGKNLGLNTYKIGSVEINSQVGITSFKDFLEAALFITKSNTIKSKE